MMFTNLVYDQNSIKQNRFGHTQKCHDQKDYFIKTLKKKLPKNLDKFVANFK